MKIVISVFLMAVLCSCAARRAHRHAHAHAHAEKHAHEHSGADHSHEGEVNHTHYKVGHVVTVLPRRCVRRTVRGAVFYHDGHHWYRKHARGYIVVVKP